MARAADGGISRTGEDGGSTGNPASTTTPVVMLPGASQVRTGKARAGRPSKTTRQLSEGRSPRVFGGAEAARRGLAGKVIPAGMDVLDGSAGGNMVSTSDRSTVAGGRRATDTHPVLRPSSGLAEWVAEAAIPQGWRDEDSRAASISAGGVQFQRTSSNCTVCGL